MSADQATRADGLYEYDFAPDRRRAAAASVQWRKRVVWFMVWACAAIVLALIIIFMFYSGMFERRDDTPVAKQGEIADTVNVGDLKFTGFDKKNQAYSITADSAEQDDDQPNIIYLDQVRAEMKLKGSGDVIFVTSDRGTYDTEAETVRLEDNIKMRSTSGYTAELHTADIELKHGRVRSEDPVVVSTSRGTIWSNGLDLQDRGKRILFKNRIRVLFQMKNQKADSG